jgi:hypothetical protein
MQQPGRTHRGGSSRRRRARTRKGASSPPGRTSSRSRLSASSESKARKKEKRAGARAEPEGILGTSCGAARAPRSDLEGQDPCGPVGAILWLAHGVSVVGVVGGVGVEGVEGVEGGSSPYSHGPASSSGAARIPDWRDDSRGTADRHQLHGTTELLPSLLLDRASTLAPPPPRPPNPAPSPTSRPSGRGAAGARLPPASAAAAATAATAATTAAATTAATPNPYPPTLSWRRGLCPLGRALFGRPSPRPFITLALPPPRVLSRSGQARFPRRILDGHCTNSR